MLGCRYGGGYGEYHVEPGLQEMHDHAWADEMYFAAPHKTDKSLVSIDPHILCTPAIGECLSLDRHGRRMGFRV